jgi:glutathione peroxidase
MSAFHDLEMTSITGEPVPFDRYRGQLCLVVNVASECGLTPQYAGLQALHDDNDDLTVLGFPCNQFGRQEPGTDQEVLDFATSRFGVTFPLFSKIEVNGDGACDLYRMLKEAQPGDGDGDGADVQWNFEKFLVDGDGTVVARFSPRTAPEAIADVLPEHR